MSDKTFRNLSAVKTYNPAESPKTDSNSFNQPLFRPSLRLKIIANASVKSIKLASRFVFVGS